MELSVITVDLLLRVGLPCVLGWNETALGHDLGSLANAAARCSKLRLPAAGSSTFLAGKAAMRLPHSVVVCIAIACCCFAFQLGAAAVPMKDPTQVSVLQAALSAQANRPPKLLYVMEYDCIFDWEPVSLETGVTDDVLEWLSSLKDRLTVTSRQPLGDELIVSLHLL